jgi:23S rRNA (adenine2503-C2)-methyltransferase
MKEAPMGRAQIKKELIHVNAGRNEPPRYAEAIYYEREDKQVICFSTQLSCSVGCAFCASPGPEKTVNLTAGEILAQINYFGADINMGKVTLLSVMGEGEPLLNYSNVMKALKLAVKHEAFQGVGGVKIALSTSGAAPAKIKQLAKHNRFYTKYDEAPVPFKLQVSLHFAGIEKRVKYMKNAASLRGLQEALSCYTRDKGAHAAPVELNIALIDGVNDSLYDAVLVVANFPEYHIKVSKYNMIERAEFKPATDQKTAAFVAHLDMVGMSVEYHETDGSGIGGACGQTRGMRKS